LLKPLAQRPDLTLRGLLTELVAAIKVSCYAVWHFEHERISFKRSLHASEQDLVAPASAHLQLLNSGVRGSQEPIARLASCHQEINEVDGRQ
jgi:hypothetical protein